MSESKPKFQKLTPIRDAEIGIYSDALDYVFENDDLRNIAVSGAYSAGKSSVLESYKAKHTDRQFLHISLAHFEESADEADHKRKEQSGEQQSEVKESVLEGKILNQLIHQISASRIPQTNFRIKQKIEPKQVVLRTVAVVVFTLALLHVIFFGNWQNYVESISSVWIKTILWLSTRNSSILLTGAVCVALSGILLYHIINAQVNKGIFKKISADKFEIEIFEGSDDSYFDKYLNEVLYLFDQCEADVIVFEDMDRYNANRIFERLREVNNLINTQRSKTGKIKPLRFLYLLRDDIFVSKDRTKFFDFIIPVVPVVDGSNSYDQFIKHLTDSDVFGLFDEPFLQGLSLYIDDMRILKNICNEFLIYNSRLNITELNHNKLMAMIAYKNLFPRDFSDLQLGKGFVFTLFDKKEQFIADRIAKLEAALEIAEARLEAAKKEHLTSMQELDLVKTNRTQSINNVYQRNYNHQQQRASLQQLETEYSTRKQAIDDLNNKRMPVVEAEISQLKSEIAATKSASLHDVITRENISEIFAITSENEIGTKSDFKDIRGNAYFALLKYLIRNGFIDESYADYMTYFYEHSLNRTDKIFLRSVSDQLKKESTYPLKEPEKVLARLNATVFRQPEVLNNDLLFYLLQECAYDYDTITQNGIVGKVKSCFPRFPLASDSTNKANQCLIDMVDQILEEKDYAFLQGVFLATKDNRLNYLVNYLNTVRKDCLTRILTGNAEFAASCADDFAFRTLIAYCKDDLRSDENFFNALSDYISSHPSFIETERYEEEKLQEMFGRKILDANSPGGNLKVFLTDVEFISKMQALFVRFKTIDCEKAHPILFDIIYQEGLYELNFENISHLLKIKYGINASADFAHKNYTLIRTSPDSPLADRVEFLIDDYIDVILSVCGKKISDNESDALNILNNKAVSVEHKKSYIASLVTVIQTIFDVKDNTLWQSLITSGRIEHTEKNVLDYFCACDHVLTQELVGFIDGQGNEYDYTKSREAYDDSVQSKFFNAILRCNALNNEHYRQILKTLHRIYSSGFSVEDVADDKILILIDSGVIPMHQESLLFLRDNYPDAVIPYIQKYIQAYVNEILDDENFDLNEALKVLLLGVADKYKLSLLKKIDDPLTARKQQYSDAIKAYILANNLDVSDISHFTGSYPHEGTMTKVAIEKITIDSIQTIFDDGYSIDQTLVDKLMASNISHSNKLKLFALLLPALGEAQCKDYLQQLGLQEYMGLFEQKRPKIGVTEISTRILDIFRRKGWITKFEEDDKEDGYYRAFGRKAHEEDKEKEAAAV